MSWLRPKNTEPALPPATSRQAAGKHAEATQMQKLINLGKSIRIKGELTGSEDLTIEGKLDGKITLDDHHLTIGENGHIKAEIRAKGVIIAGELVGNVTAVDKVEVAASGSMNGDIRAPRVILADGARFRGSIDMEPLSAGRRDAVPASAGAPETAKRSTPPHPVEKRAPAKQLL